MGSKKRPGSRSRRRLRISVRLTDFEASELELAALESGALSRNLVVTEAIKIGLLNPNLNLDREKRSKRIRLRIPRDTVDELKELASEHNLTLSFLLRHFLFQYLANAPWHISEPNGTASESRVTEAALS